MSCCPSCGAPIVESDGLVIDEMTRTVTAPGGACAALTPSLFAVFLYLRKARGRYVTYDAIFDHLYQLRPGGEDVDIAILKVWACKLRRKLAPLGLAIEVQYGTGYRLKRKTPEVAA